MARANDYHFITRWTLSGTTCEEITEILGEASDLPRWWPSVYLDVRILEEAGEDGVGRRVELFTKGWLPYTLRWTFRVVESRKPHGFTLEAEGDFSGRGIWTFTQSGSDVIVVYDWRIRAEKPLLKAFSFALKPVFARNHHWAMRKGEESLRLELQRRHARTAAERAAVPAPPPPTFTRR